MAVENIAWMTHGGKHSAALGRMVAFAATSGAEGVMGIGDLKVRAADIANGTVIVAPGGAVMVNRYPNDINETYMGRVTSDTVLAVAPNGGGSTRYDLVIARIDDWNKPGGQAAPGVLPTDTVPSFKLQVLANVPAETKTALERGLNYPAIALARIAIPAGTGAITNAMITPLREMANPRRQRSLTTRAVAIGSIDTLDATVAGGGELWPNVGGFTVEIPPWATRARIIGHWGGVLVPSGNTRTGQLWVRVGNGTPSAFNTQGTNFDGMGLTQSSRQSFDTADDVAIPAALRGQSTMFHLFGGNIGGAGGYLTADPGSSIYIDIEFLEAPAEDV